MGGPELWQSPGWRKLTHATCRPFSGERNRDGNNYQGKKYFHWQLRAVSFPGRIPGGKGFTQGGLCHFMDAHPSTVCMFQRDSGRNVFLCTFPITVAQISLPNHPSSYLPSLVAHSERGCSGGSAAAKRRRWAVVQRGRAGRRGRLKDFA